MDLGERITVASALKLCQSCPPGPAQAARDRGVMQQILASAESAAAGADASVRSVLSKADSFTGPRPVLGSKGSLASVKMAAQRQLAEYRRQQCMHALCAKPTVTNHRPQSAASASRRVCVQFGLRARFSRERFGRAGRSRQSGRLPRC